MGSGEWGKLRVLVLLLVVLSFCLSLISGTFSGFNAQSKINPQIIDISRFEPKYDFSNADLNTRMEQSERALNLQKLTGSNQSRSDISEELASIYNQLGENQQAIAVLEDLLAYYRQREDWTQVGRILTLQAQVYNNRRQPQLAQKLLNSALQIAQTRKLKALEAIAKGTRGEAYRLEGNLKEALTDLQASLGQISSSDRSLIHTSFLNSLGKVYSSLARVNYRQANWALESGDINDAQESREQAKSYDRKALSYFQQSLTIARVKNNRAMEIRAIVASILAYQRTNQLDNASIATQQAWHLLEYLPDNQEKIYTQIQLAKSLQLIDDAGTSLSFCPQDEGKKKALYLLSAAVSLARKLHLKYELSLALGYTAQIYECNLDYKRALEFTEKAQLAAQGNSEAENSLYLWLWQAGRILQAQNKEAQAIKFYQEAVTNLEKKRPDIGSLDIDSQFDFRSDAQRIYRELIALKLGTISFASQIQQQYLQDALKSIDALKFIELQNYLGGYSAITLKNTETLESINTNINVAVLTSIIFAKQTAVILTLPNNVNKYTWIAVDKNTLNKEINAFRLSLEDRSNPIYDPALAQKLYRWLIEPFAVDLETSQINTLVFIQDGILRSIPMAALHDGKQFLIERYAIATTFRLSLTAPTSWHPPTLERALFAGLTQEATVDGVVYKRLSNVAMEIKQLAAKIPNTKKLLDRDFTINRLQSELSKKYYPIIHIATHGEFDSYPEESFLVTGDNQKLTVSELGRTLELVTKEFNPVILLALTACESARGDYHAALGLAGVALQAGVKSTIASLWSIDDASTAKLMTAFYDFWCNQKMSKAQALRKAQQEIIALKGKYAHPFYWAPYVLVGNWF